MSKKSTEVKPFADIFTGLAKATVTKTVTKVQANFADRMAFETTNSPKNKTIQTKLTSYAKKFAMPNVVGALMAANADLSFMNQSVAGNETKRFNVYAIDKVADLAQALESGTVKNAINHATLINLFKAAANGVDFTSQHAQGSVSDKVALPAGHSKWMTRHTASASTAPTQASSTMNALQVLNVVENKGTTKAPVWHLTETPQTERFRNMFSAKAA